MKNLLTLALCMFCSMSFLSAEEVDEEEVALETTTEEDAAEEVATADTQNAKKVVQEEKSSCTPCRK